MTYKLVFETDDINELQRVAALISANGKESNDTLAPEPTPVVKVTYGKARKPKEDKMVDYTVNVTVPEVPTPTEIEITYDDVRKATLELIKLKGKAAAVDILDGMKVASAPELKPEQYAEYLELVATAKSRL